MRIEKPILTRTCKIRKGTDRETELKICFYKPKRRQHETYARAVVTSVYFDIPFGSIGSDEVQAFVGLFKTVLARLRRLQDEGYSIFWIKPGDLDFSDFWAYLP